MPDDTLIKTIENLDLPAEEKKQLTEVVQDGLSHQERAQLLERSSDIADFLYRLNDMINKKRDYLVGADDTLTLDELLEEEERLLNELQR
ncbi:MAG: hypothetical protein WDZ79_00105 [Candidatus Paceibacterota bacterium]